ncbi:MAG: hypothetical protein AAF591_14340 [Verrucomicrobiota bacterium]
MMAGKEKGGCLAGIMILVLLPLLSIWISARAFTPADMSGIEGLRIGPGAVESRDLREVMARAGRGGVVIEEAEVNAYLRATLFGRETGLARFVSSFEGACVELREDEAEIFLVRRCFGRLSTVSFVLSIEDGPEGRFVRSEGSSVGRIQIPELVFQFVLDSFRRMAGVYEEELRLIQGANVLKIREGHMIIGN